LLLCAQRCTSSVAAISDARSFVECGATSIDALLMTEDLKHIFSSGSHTSHDDERYDERLPLLMDRILHSTLSDVVQYIASQLSARSTSHTAAAAAAAAVDDDDDHDGDGDDDDTSAPAVKRLRTSASTGSTATNSDIRVENEFRATVSHTAGANAAAATDDDDVDDDAKAECNQTEPSASCSCQAVLSSSCRRCCARVFCQHCHSYQQLTTADDLRESSTQLHRRTAHPQF